MSKQLKGSFILMTLFLLSPITYCFESLTNNEMDLITAGSATVPRNELVSFEFNRRLGSGRKVDGTGSLEFRPTNIGNYTNGNLVLRDNAQNNLSALININAVNSPVQVLLNLNININSKVGSVNQSNFSLPPLIR